MAQPVELAGDTLLNELNLKHSLSIATKGSNPEATKILENWQTSENYYSLLQDVFIDQSLPREMRMLSLIIMKNGVEKYWRKSATNAIRPAERETVRSRLLQSSLNEPEEQLVTLNSIVTAKVARFDFPGQWSKLFVEIIQAMQSTDQQYLDRALTIALQVVKELSTVRLQRSRASLFNEAPDLFNVTRDIYRSKAGQFSANQPASAAQSVLKTTSKCLKIIRRLAVAGYEFPHRSDELNEFFSESPRHVEAFLDVLKSGNLDTITQQIVGSNLMQLAKLHLTLGQDHPISFALMPRAIDVVVLYWNLAKDIRSEQLRDSEHWRQMAEFYDKFNLKALLLQRASIRMVYQPTNPFKYKAGGNKEEPQQARDHFKTHLLTEAYAKDMFENLVSRFLMYLESELEDWATESEDWEAKVEGAEDAHDRSVRPCAERLLMDLALHYKDTLTDYALALVSNVANQNGTEKFKDAVYSAIGAAAPMLKGKFDFDALLTQSLTHQLSESGVNQKILRRRIAVLISQWINVGISASNKPLVYEIYQHLLDKSVPANDLAVRITAGKRLCDVIDDWGFQADQFLPYATSMLGQIVQLIQDVDLVESKVAIIRTLTAIVERMEVSVAPFADQIIALLPPLWTESRKENMMKQEIVILLTRLIEAMKTDSTPAHSLVAPIIENAIDPASDTQVFLLDDALDLWSSILYYAKEPASAELLAMAPKFLQLLEMENSIIEKAIDIQHMYLLLAPSQMLQDDMRHKIIASATSLLEVHQSHIISGMMDNIEMMIRAADKIGGEEAVTAVVKDLIEHNFMGKILNSIYLNWQANRTSGPKRMDFPKDWKNETDYFSLFARIIMANGNAFILIVEEYAKDEGYPFEKCISPLLDEWFHSLDGVVDPELEKQLGLALTKLLETKQPWILNRLQDLMDLWTSLVVELRDGDEKPPSDSLVYLEPMRDPLPNEAAQEVRKRQLLYEDPAHVIHLGEYVKSHLGDVIASCGGEEQFQEQWLANVDADVIKHFGNLGL